MRVSKWKVHQQLMNYRIGWRQYEQQDGLSIHQYDSDGLPTRQEWSRSNARHQAVKIPGLGITLNPPTKMVAWASIFLSRPGGPVAE